MKKLFTLVAAVLVVSSSVVSSSPAMAAGQTIQFTNGIYTNPTGITASVIQAFTTNQTNGQQVALGNAASPAISDAKAGNALTIRSTARTGMTGNYLQVRKGTVPGVNSSYTIDFNSSVGVQFVSFVLGNYQATNSVVVQYVTGAVNTFNLLNFAGLNGLTAGATGRFSIDQGSDVAIKSIAFSNPSTANSMFIDSISAVAAPTPEPAAWMMMILGFGLAGAQLRRRRSAVKFTAA